MQRGMVDTEKPQSSTAPKSEETSPSIPFHHPSNKYRKVAPIAAILIAVGSFFLSMAGDGEPNYDIMQIGAYGCCSLLNVAFISQAIYQQKLDRTSCNVRRGKERFESRVHYCRSVGTLWHDDPLGESLLNFLKSAP